ncbi:MAG TPA: TIGR03560 family F420-dependent LLM class oxidoreductase [Thermodesulfobacteriota bacterium]|jgi:F420-dependent oxidoreductase-like protein
MSKVRFGVVLRQEKIDFKPIRETAELCDELGYHSVWFYDHLLGMGSIDSDILEAWTLMSALSTVTSKVKIGTLVLCNSFRPPSLLAKMAATLDNISSGRLEFAIGAGWFEPEYRAYGYPFLNTVTRIEQLREAVKIIRALWTEERATLRGKYYQIEDAYCNPKPVQKPHPAIIIGGSGERYLLRVVAELADEWNCPASNASEYDRKLKVLKNHCKELGRDMNEIAISEQTVCVIAENKAELEEKLPKAKKRYGFFGDIEKTGIVGTPDECIERINNKVEKGVSKFTIFFSDIMKPESLRFFSKEVMSAF